jgi:uncharacterized protein (TIGR02271 family)
MCYQIGVAQAIRVSGKDGWRGIVHSWFGGPSDTTDLHEITIRLDTGEVVVVKDTVLTGRPDGSYYVPLSLEEIRGPEAAAPPIPVATPAPVPTPAPAAAPDIQTSTREVEQIVDIPIVEERVEVERIAVNRTVDGPVAVRYDGDTIIVPVTEEVLIVQKQLRLVEEVHIRKVRVERHDPQRMMLRKDEVRVEPQENRSVTDDVRPI